MDIRSVLGLLSIAFFWTSARERMRAPRQRVLGTTGSGKTQAIAVLCPGRASVPRHERCSTQSLTQRL